MIYINGTEYTYQPNQPIEAYTHAPYAVCALVNNAVYPLDTVPKDGVTIQLLTVNSRGGFFCYGDAATNVFNRCARRVR